MINHTKIGRERVKKFSFLFIFSFEFDIFFVNRFYLNKLICAEIDGGKSLNKKLNFKSS
jgi:hypothetical protein